MKNTDQYISSRTRRNVARYHQDFSSEDIQQQYNEINEPPPLAESLLNAIFTSPQLPPHWQDEDPPQPPLPPTDPTAAGRKGKKKAGVFGFFKKLFRRKKPALMVNLNDFSSVSSKESSDRRLGSKKSSLRGHSFPTEKIKDGEQSVNSNEVSASSNNSEVFPKMRSNTSFLSVDSDKTSVVDPTESADKVGDLMLDSIEETDVPDDSPPGISYLRMTFSRDEDDIKSRVLKGEFGNRDRGLQPDPRTAGMMKLTADSEESHSDGLPIIQHRSSTLTSNPTFSTSGEDGNVSRFPSSAFTTTETSPMYIRPTASNSPLGAPIPIHVKSGPTVTIAADTVDNSADYNRSNSIKKLKSEKSLKRAQQSSRMSRSFMVRPSSQIMALSPLNRAPSTIELSLSPLLWRSTSQPVLSQRPQLQFVPRYNSTSAIPTAKPTEEFLAGLPYQPSFQSFYAKSFYIPKSPTASTALAMHEFNYPAPILIPTYSDIGPSFTETSTTARTTNPATSLMNSFYVPASPYPRAPATALRRRNSSTPRYGSVDPSEQSHYGEIQNFHSLSQFLNLESFINTAPPPYQASHQPSYQPHTEYAQSYYHPAPPPPPPPLHQQQQQQQQQQHQQGRSSSSASFEPSLSQNSNYHDYSDLSEDHSYSYEPTYIELQRRRERKYEEAKKRKDIERINDVALREAIQLSLEEERSHSSTRSRKQEEIEKTNEEALRVALILSMQEVKNQSQHSIDTSLSSTNNSSTQSQSHSYNPSFNNTNRNSLNRNYGSGFNSTTNSKPPSRISSRPPSRASNFPTEDYPPSQRFHYPSSISASHSHSSTPPSSLTGTMNYSSTQQQQQQQQQYMKKISSGTLSHGGQSRESGYTYTPPYGETSSILPAEQQRQRRSRRIQRIVLDSQTALPANYSAIIQSTDNNNNASSTNTGGNSKISGFML